MAVPQRPTITFRPVDPPHGTSVTAYIAPGFITPTADGGWTVVTRPKQIGMTDWTGTAPMTLDIPVMFDGLVGEHTVETPVGRLFQMMRQRVGTRNEPVVVEFSSRMLLPYNMYRWNIINIAPGTNDDDEIRRNQDGHRVRANMVVTLQEYIPGDLLLHGTRPSPAKTHKAKTSAGKTHKPSHSSVRIYHVKRGDTLSKIAAKELGKASKWHEIANLNKIRDPDKIKPGEKLKIPKK